MMKNSERNLFLFCSDWLGRNCYWLALLWCITFAAVFVAFEDNAYIWDQKFYCDMYGQYNELLRESPLSWLKAVRREVLTSEYNPLFSVFLLPFNILFERSRLGFIEGVTTVFLFPAMAIAFFLKQRLFVKAKLPLSRASQTLLFLFTFLFAPFWACTLLGLPDVISIIPLSLAIWFLCFTKLTERQPLVRLVTIALCLYLPFLFRKWYAYSIVAVILSGMLLCFYDLYRQQFNRLAIGAAIRNYFLMGGMVVLALALLQGKLVLHIFQTDYARLYAAYQVDSSQHLPRFFDNFGWGVPLLAGCGLVLSWKNRVLARYAVFIAITLVAAFLLFTRTQSFSVQHYLPVAYCLYSLVAIFIGMVFSQYSRLKVPFFVVLLALLIVYPFHVLSLYSIPEKLKHSLLLPRDQFPRRKIENFNQYFSLAQSLKPRLEEGRTWAVLASSNAFNDSLFTNFFDDQTVSHLLTISNVDSKDPFKASPLFADYLIVGEPGQTHLRPEDQRVVTIPAQQLASGQGIGGAYSLVSEYTLAAQAKAKVLKKERPFKEAELKPLYEAIFAYYPEWRSGISPYSVAALMAEFSVGGKQGSFFMQGEGRIILRAGEEGSARIQFTSWPDWVGIPHGDQQMAIFSVELSQRYKKLCPSSPGVPLLVKADGQVLFDQVTPPKETRFFKVPFALLDKLSFEVPHRVNPSCDEIYIDFR